MENNKTQQYLNSKKRITNKTRKLETRIKNLKPESQEKIKQSCPIGRKREGFNREKIKKQQSYKELVLTPNQAKCTRLDKNNFIQEKGYKRYFCDIIRKFISARICKTCKNLPNQGEKNVTNTIQE
jgi:hypothetical protein